MTFSFRIRVRLAWLVFAGLSCAATVPALAEPAPSAAAAGFNSYAAATESRLARQHANGDGFVAGLNPSNAARLRHGELIIESLAPALAEIPSGAALYHWRGTAFAPGATAVDFERLMQNIKIYPQVYSPQILQARLLAQQGDHLQATMRLRQKHGITVVMDATYDIRFGRLDAHHGFSASRSTRIAEVEAAGTAHERALSADEEHGFLWRMNTYWTYEEGDGGLYMQIESVSLTRAIPRGLGWVIGPFVESVPRDALEFTLRSTCNALRK